MTLQINDLPCGCIPNGMVRVRWLLKCGRTIETAEIDDIDRIRQSQFVLPDDSVYEITSVARHGDALIARCWPATP